MPRNYKKRNISDEEILALIKEGNKNAFSELFHRYYQPVFLFCRGVLKDRFVAEDLAQEVFLKIWDKRGGLYCTKDGLQRFIFKVCRNHVFDFLRKKYVQSAPIENVREEQASMPSFEEKLYADEMKTSLDDVLQAMPRQRRTVFCLSREEHLSRKEIAAQMNISEATVKKHMELALKQIRETGNFKN